MRRPPVPALPEAFAERVFPCGIQRAAIIVNDARRRAAKEMQIADKQNTKGIEKGLQVWYNTGAANRADAARTQVKKEFWTAMLEVCRRNPEKNCTAEYQATVIFSLVIGV